MAKYTLEYTGEQLDDLLAKANVSVSQDELNALLNTAGGNVALFKVDYAQATSKTTGTTSSYITTNDTCFFDLGFTPKAVIVFNIDSASEDTGSNYAREKTYWYPYFSYEKFYEYSDYDNENYEDYGGIAWTGAPAIGLSTKMEMIWCVENGVKILNYYYYKEMNDGGDNYKIVNCSGSYCLAIG